MSKPQFLTALDIGSSVIKGISVIKKDNTDEYEVFAKAELPSLGVRRGVVQEPHIISEKISKIVRDLETATGEEISDVIININGSNIFVEKSKGKVAISRADGNISKEDVNRVIETAEAISLPPNTQILETVNTDFLVDGEAIRDPVGMSGRALEADTLMLCVKNVLKNSLEEALEISECNIIDIVPSIIASCRSVLSIEQKELGVVLLDIGGGTTSMAVFEEGKLIHLAIFPVGSDNITNDIAIGLQTEVSLAEDFKRRFGLEIPKATIRKNKKGEDNKNPENVAYNQKELAKIVDSRIYEIFYLIQEELKKIGKDRKLPAGAIITGGGAKIKGVVDYAKKQLKIPVQLGFPKNFINQMESDAIKDPAWSTICGLAMFGLDNVKDFGSSKGGFGSAIKKFFKLFKP